MKKGLLCAVAVVLLTAGLLLGPFMANEALHWLYPRPFLALVEREAAEFNLEEELVYAVMKAESGFNQRAVSRAGAQGLMQLTPSTFQWIASQEPPENGGVDAFDPADNLHCGCALLRRLLDYYGSREVALAAYNAGMGNVSGWLSQEEYSRDGESLHRIPYPETAAYVKKVGHYYEVYRRLYVEP